MDYFNNEGHFNDEAIALYADAIKLDKMSELPKGFKTHLESCSICQHHVVDFTSIMADIKQEAATAHPYFNAKKETTQTPSKETTAPSGNIRSLIFRIAVAAILGALIFVGYRQFNTEKTPELVKVPSKDNQKQEDIKPQPNTPSLNQKEVIVENPKNQDDQKVNQNKPTPKEPTIDKVIEQNNLELFAANYVPSDELESMIGTTTRSENFPISAPNDGARFKEKQSILFQWENNIKLNLTILDNQEEEVFLKELEGTSFNFENKLSPGIYYWKIETAEDLLHLGKFIVE